MHSIQHILIIYFYRGTAQLYYKVQRLGAHQGPCLCSLYHLGTSGGLWRVLTLFLFQPGAEQLPSQEPTHLLLQEVRCE